MGMIWNRGVGEMEPQSNYASRAIKAADIVLSGHPTYLPSNPEIHYQGFVGVFAEPYTPPIAPVWQRPAFQGELPISQQPTLDRPHPYDQLLRW